MPNYRLPLTLNALMQQSAPTNALVQRNVPNFDLLGVSQPVQNNASNLDSIYASFVEAAKRGAAMRNQQALPVGVGQYNTYSTEGNLPHNQRKPIVRPGGVTEYNPLTKEEADLVNHPSVKWIKEHDEQGRLLSSLPSPWGNSDNGGKNPSLSSDGYSTNMPDVAPSEEYRKHMKILGELAKRNPQVMYAAGIADDLVNRPGITDQGFSVQGMKEDLNQRLRERELRAAEYGRIGSYANDSRLSPELRAEAERIGQYVNRIEPF